MDFTVEGATLRVAVLRSGYRAKQLETDAGLQLHREFVGAF